MFILLLGMAFGAGAAHAHHGYANEFDSNAPFQLTGKVTKVELINPHSWIHIRVEEKGKSPQHWMLEGGTPNTLFRAGITKDSLKVGTEITVRGYRAHDRSCKPACRGSGRDLTLPNGKKLFMKVEAEGEKKK